MEKQTQIEILLEREAEKQFIEKEQKKQRKRESKLKPFPCSDGKTVFYCRDDEKGKAAVERFERRLKQFTNL